MNPSSRRLSALAFGLLLVWSCGSEDSSSTASGTGASGSGASGSTSNSSSGSGSGGSGASGSGGSAAGGNGAGVGGAGGASAAVRFVAFGDAGKANQGQIDVANAVAAKCAQDGCDFIQLLGDNIYDSGVDSTTDPQWQTKFEQPYANLNYDFWAVLGNHDYGGNGTGNEFGKGQNEIDYTQVSSKWKMPAAYYKRSVSNVEFFSLDTNMAMYLQAGSQTTEINTWITQSTATWRIAFGHHPYLSNGPHGNAGEYEGLPFVPIVNGAGVKDILDSSVCGKADVYISGHDHSRQWNTNTCSGTELIVSGAGASGTELTGSNPTYFESIAEGFLYVVIQGNTFTGEFIDTSGTVNYTRTLTK